MKKLIICGDSFSYGIGCVNLETQPYGVLTAGHFKWDCIRLARGSASNYAIYLQAMYAADLEDKPHLIVLGQTSYDRVEWVSETYVSKINNYETHTLNNLNYHQYPPHHSAMPHHDNPMPFYTDNVNYTPYILSEQVGGIDDCIITRKKHPDNNYYERLKTEPDDKLKLIRDYYLRIFDSQIKKSYDIGLLVSAYHYIKSKGIACIILTRDVSDFSKFVNPDDILYHDWWEMVQKYPDTIGSFHTSEEGHRETADKLIKKIKELTFD